MLLIAYNLIDSIALMIPQYLFNIETSIVKGGDILSMSKLIANTLGLKK